MLKRGLLFALFLLFVTSVNALSIDSIKIISDIDGKYDYRNYELQIHDYTSSCLKEISIPLPHDSKIYYVKNDYGNLYYQYENTITIFFENCILEENIILKTRSKEIDDIGRYLFEYKPINELTRFTHIVKLPDRTLIKYSPQTDIISQNQRNILTWEYENPTEIIHIIKFAQKENYLPVILAIVISILLLITIFLRKKINKLSNFSMVSTLNEKEKQIMQIIIKNKGINQSILKHKTGLTKSNISKIVSKLEFRGLIIKKSEGKINRLYIGEKLKKQ